MTGQRGRPAEANRRPTVVMLVISNLEYGGAQRQVVELANHLDAREFDVHVCSLSSYVPLACDLRRPERLHIIEKRFKFDVTVVPRLASLLRRTRTDIAQSYLFDADIATFIAGRLARTPIVAGSERNADYTLKRRQYITYRWTRGCVDLIIANSHAGARFNRQLLGYPASRYHVVHNGVDVERFRPTDGTETRQLLGIEPDEQVVGVFASFKPQKNHALFFKAAARVLHSVPRTRLLLVGDELYAGMHGSDRYKAEIFQLVDQLGLRDRCIFAGNQDDVRAYYAACDLTVMSSHFEGTANAVLESLACGVPVVATDVSDTALVAPDNQVGFIVPPGDEEMLARRISALLTDRDLRAAMSRRARAWILERFSTELLAVNTANVYRQALRARCSGGTADDLADHLQTTS